MHQPLAERMRPQTLERYLGQPHLVGPTGAISRALKNGLIPSMILWGPPGTGKTTLAELIAKASGRPFYRLTAVSAGVKQVREAIRKAGDSGGLFAGEPPLLFIDEIHRFSKSQQDSLLQAVERGHVILLGATTENPSFEVVPALLSRVQVYVLNPFSKVDLLEIARAALTRDPLLKQRAIQLKQTAALLRFSGGDARRLLNILELLVSHLAGEAEKIVITDESVVASCTQNMAHYDKAGAQHHDMASALIKSIQGSDPNAAVYWLARMLKGGEDLKFIARRLLISASEDVGNANPNALVLANSTFQAVNAIGHPESRILLSQCAIYLATSPKSNSTYLAIGKAQQLARDTADMPVPLHLRNAPTRLMKELEYGSGYRYPHDEAQHFVDQAYLPEPLSGQLLYVPGKNPQEDQAAQFLAKRWKDRYDYGD